MAAGPFLSDDLSELADRWPLKESTYTARNGTTKPCVRCDYDNCDEMIQGSNQVHVAVLMHLLTGHGYRMDGQQYDNKNEKLGDARNACRKENTLP